MGFSRKNKIKNIWIGQFIRLITNTIREVRERGSNNNNGGNEGQQGLRFDPNQLSGILQSLFVLIF